MDTASARFEAIDVADGDLRLYREIMPSRQSASIFKSLTNELDWQQEHLKLFGRTINMPRLTAWYGDAPYTYSGLTHEPRPWPGVLAKLRTQVENLTSENYNTVLLNLYRDGSDSMAWHSDDEPELGANPAIASLNFGATRRFRFRRIDNTKNTVAIDLPDASLLLMAGPLQHFWQHALPKTRKPVGPRINLTFRWITPPP